MITIATNHPIAIDSDDHHYPDGVHLDNHWNPYFTQSIEEFFGGRKINFLDLGCAGGGLVTAMYEAGHNAIGLEGSDHCMTLDPDVIAKLGGLPLGHVNWEKYGNKRLFTCDITYDYDIIQHGNLLQFDLITCFDVMEHFHPERIDKFLEMVAKHLKSDGIFVANIALFHLIKDKILEEGQVEYHKSLFSADKWLEINSKYLTQIDYPFTCTNRSPSPRSDGNNLVYAGKKK